MSVPDNPVASVTIVPLICLYPLICFRWKNWLRDLYRIPSANAERIWTGVRAGPAHHAGAGINVTISAIEQNTFTSDMITIFTIRRQYSLYCIDNSGDGRLLFLRWLLAACGSP